MGLVDTLASEVIKRVMNRSRARTNVDVWEAERLRPHMIEVVNWSRRVEFVGLAEARDTDRDTVALFAALPRKFRGTESVIVTTTEDDLVAAPGNLVLLGDPGAGKTTTLKRIARALLDAPASIGDTSEYPLVVRLRELHARLLLEESLGRSLGIRTARITPLGLIRDQQGESGEEFQIVTGERLTLDVIAEIANNSNALFLLDGLDEIRPELRERTETTLMELARKCDCARIRITCRSGDYSRSLEGFDAIELCPLDDSQVEAIVDHWCTSPQDFKIALSKLSFRDLPSRPLFLCELIVLFERSGFLPQQPATVYKRIILLGLEEWDRSKRVERKSSYSGFDPSRKSDFLASLAFHLTYVTEQKFFTPKSFASAYESIRSGFDLPEGEARQVFTELETHTGIVVQTGFERYEFSHLSLQEFLAADYLVRGRISEETSRQLLLDSGPLAISVAMSSDASQRLAAIVLSRWTAANLQFVNLPGFLSRIAQERAVFDEDILLGFAGFAILFAKKDYSRFIESFLTTNVVLRSMGKALKAYTASELDRNTLRLQLRTGWRPPPEMEFPRDGKISQIQLQTILDICSLDLKPMETRRSANSRLGDQYFVVSRRQPSRSDQATNET